jgi:magnesium transporter
LTTRPPARQKAEVIRVFVEEAGKLRSGGVALAQLARPRWVDVEGQTPADIAWLGETFGFHPLALEDCLHLDQRPKLEDYPSAIFLVLHAFTASPDGPAAVDMHEVHAFLAKDLLVTVHQDPVPALDRARARLADDPGILARGADALLYVVCDDVVDGHLPVLDGLHDALEDLEDQVLTGEPTRKLLETMLAFRRTLVTLRRTVAPSRDVFTALAHPDGGRMSARVALYFRDVQDHLQRATESIDAGRELLAGVLDAYRSQVANRTNAVMKRLTLFSALLLPLTLITGFFGMNFESIPYADPFTLQVAIAAMVAIPAFTVAVFKWFRWI